MPDFEITNGVLETYNGKDEEVVIPDSVTRIGDYAFYECTFLASVTIPDSVTRIEEFAFFGCKSLEKVIIPDSVTSIGRDAFAECERLENIIIPDSITNIKEGTFSGCKSLKSVFLPDSVTSIGGGAFGGCESLKNITIPDGLTSIGIGAFCDCEKLKYRYNKYDGAYYLGSVNNPYFLLLKSENEKIKECTVHERAKIIYGGAFENCRSLVTITIPDSVISIGENAFLVCKKLKYNEYGGAVYLKNKNNPYYALLKANDSIIGKTKEIVIHENTKIICEGALSYCDLVSVIIPDGVTSIGDSAFFRCESLSEIIVPDSVTSIGGDAFKGCKNINKIKVPKSFSEKNVAWWIDRFEIAVLPIVNFDNFDNNAPLTKYLLKDIIKSVEILFASGRSELIYNLLEYSPEISLDDFDKIIEMASRNNDAEISFALIEYKNKKYPPSEIEKIEQDNFEKAIGLKEYTISDWENIFKFRLENETVTITGYKGTDSFVEIPEKIGKYTVTSIGSGAFYGCGFVTDIVITDSIKIIGEKAFDDCANLKYNELDGSLYLGNNNNPYYVLIKSKKCNIHKNTKIIYSDAFYGIETLVNIAIPESVTSIGKHAFANCTFLENITLPEGIISIEEWAFKDCSSLTSIIIPSLVTSIKEKTFYGCSSLTKITLPLGIKAIGDYSFYNCKSIETIFIPNSVTSIGEWAFYNCKSIESISIPDSMSEIGNGAFYHCEHAKKIIVPKSFSTKDMVWWKERFDEYILPIIALENFDKSALLTKAVLRDKMTLIEALIMSGRNDLLYKLFECSKKISLEVLDKMIETSANKNGSEVTSILIDYKNEKYPPSKLKQMERDRIEKAAGLKEYTVSDWKKIFNFTIQNENIKITGYKGDDWTVNIPEKIGKNSVKSIGNYAFQLCKFLKSITIPDSVTSIGKSAFNMCRSLKSIIIPDSVTSIEEEAFAFCESLVNITIPNSVNSIGDRVFFRCKSLESVILPNGVTSIGELAFAFCEFLVNITIPNSVKSIGESAFNNCGSLKSITIPDSVTSIGHGAFNKCRNLKSITIPDSVTSIGWNAFSGCHMLTIKAHKNSYAEKYAKEDNIKFEEI